MLYAIRAVSRVVAAGLIGAALGCTETVSVDAVPLPDAGGVTWAIDLGLSPLDLGPDPFAPDADADGGVADGMPPTDLGADAAAVDSAPDDGQNAVKGDAA